MARAPRGDEGALRSFAAQMGRPGLSSVQKKELWRRWKKGESLSEIGRALGRRAGSIHGVVKAGGIVPPDRTRSPRTLSLVDREEISRGLARHESIRRIAIRLRRAPSTVSREVKRHGDRRSYRAVRAKSESLSRFTSERRKDRSLESRLLPSSGWRR